MLIKNQDPSIPPSSIIIMIHKLIVMRSLFISVDPPNFQKEIFIKKPMNEQNAGETTLKKITTPGKSFSYPCKLCCNNLTIVYASSLEYDGDSVV